MRSILNMVNLAALLLVAAQSVAAGKAEQFFARAKVFEKRAAGARGAFKNPVLQRNAEHLFLNSKTEPFAVNGTDFPQVPFDIGESYAGLLPISQSPNETREAFFWFFPTTNPDKKNETTVWLNGGTGCSGLGGFLIENGVFTWDFGTLEPTQNPYTWVNLTNMLWVLQPVAGGYTVGTTNITNEYELGQQFIGFYKNFVDLFGLHKWKTYITGESYAGYYVPYVANAFIEANDTDYYDLAGIAVNDVVVGDTVLQSQMTVQPFMDYWQKLLYLNGTFAKHLEKLHNDCGYQAYLDKYFKFPPPSGPFPVPSDPQAPGGNASCDIFDIGIQAATEINPCFDFYRITDTCPYPYTVLNDILSSNYTNPGAEIFFDRDDVKKALHVSPNANCIQNDAFVGGGGDNDNDNTLPAAQDGVLQRVIEHTNNVVIGSGRLDYLLNTDGLLLALQNVTWNGKQGFQQYPNQSDLFVPYHPEYNNGSLAGAGIQGRWGAERGVTFYTSQLAGHKIPGNVPGVGYRAIELVTGRIANLSQGGDFTTQHGNFGNPST